MTADPNVQVVLACVMPDEFAEVDTPELVLDAMMAAGLRPRIGPPELSEVLIAMQRRGELHRAQADGRSPAYWAQQFRAVYGEDVTPEQIIALMEATSWRPRPEVVVHESYSGPLRWKVCAGCHQPWPCEPARQLAAAADGP